MKKNLIGAFVIFAVTLAILLLLNTLTTPHPSKGESNKEIATDKDMERRNPNLATNILN